MTITVDAVQDRPTVALSPDTGSVAEDTDLLLSSLGGGSLVTLGDVDYQDGGRTYDAAWQGTATVTAAQGVLRSGLTASLVQAPVAQVMTTTATGSTTGTPAVDTGREASQAVSGTGLSGSPLVHDTGANQGWTVTGEQGGLLLDLGEVYALDALQVWNFNELGLEGYGTQDFTLWVSTSGTQPTSTADMTQVDGNGALGGNQPFTLSRAATGDPTYQGQTYLMNGTTAAMLPATLGDEDGTRVTGPRNIYGRWVLLGNLQGQTGLGHVGLSEVQVYGRPQADLLNEIEIPAAANLTSTQADGSTDTLPAVATNHDAVKAVNVAGTTVGLDDTPGSPVVHRRRRIGAGCWSRRRAAWWSIWVRCTRWTRCRYGTSTKRAWKRTGRRTSRCGCRRKIAVPNRVRRRRTRRSGCKWTATGSWGGRSPSPWLGRRRAMRRTRVRRTC